jgi:transmembrane sensor
MNEEVPNNNREMDDAYRVAWLIAGYIGHTLTPAERDELDEWVTASDENMRLFVELTDEKNIAKGLKERGFYNADKAVGILKQRIAGKAYEKPLRRIPFLAVGIAASLVLLAGVYLFTPLFEKKKTATSVAVKDLPPGSDKAILTLPGGKQIVLDSTRGKIVAEDQLDVTNENGTVSYTGEAAKIEYHTLTTPRGGQYQLVLPDGSKVWLNAASSIKFPTAFNGAERKVELTGEAYFEVTHDASKPFHVSVLPFARGQGKPAPDEKPIEVEVLGTHFNVNAYSDEAMVKVSLLEGSVKVKGETSNVKLKPGQQASADDSKLIVDDADVEEAVAWKEGLFEFKDAPIEEIMRQVARWYNVEVKYEGKPGYHFNASIKRNVPVSKVFHLLELTDQVHFTIDKTTIIVKP